MRVYLTGQNNFGNRGCEALVRSTVLAIRSRWPDATFLVPSLEPARDAAQWPDAASSGVAFVRAPEVPWFLSKWGGLCLRWPTAAAGPWPSLSRRGADADLIGRADVVLSIGGDNLSLDYEVASLAYFVAVHELALSLGRPVAVWGASIGPFSRMPAVERHMAEHLARVSMISVRESRSMAYLQGLGLGPRLTPVVDSAFLLLPQVVAAADFWPRQVSGGVLGLNISWLLDDIRRRARGSSDLVEQVARFVRRVISHTNLSVLLVPHVASLDGAAFNNDERMNERIREALADVDANRVGQVPSGLNAAQLKHVISCCRFLIAGRTHATIAAFSTGVPTISIAYSVKARGINEDLFDTDHYVLPTDRVDAESLWGALQLLLRDEEVLRTLYAQRSAGWRQRAAAGVDRLAEVVRGRPPAHAL